MINGHYWLLDSAVECGVPLSILAAPNLELVLNRAGHGLAAEEITSSIAQMVSAGELGISLLDEPGGRWRRVFEMPEDRILELITRPRDHPDFICSGYHLTKKGGDEWEDWAQPDWARYNTNSMRIPERSTVHYQTIVAATAPLAYELFELEKLLHDERCIVPGSARLNELRPWKATYWKTLPEGFEFRFRSRPRNPTGRKAWDRWCALRKWYERPALTSA